MRKKTIRKHLNRVNKIERGWRGPFPRNPSTSQQLQASKSIKSSNKTAFIVCGGYCKYEQKKMGWSDFRDIFVNTIPSTSSTSSSSTLYTVFIILNKIWKNNFKTGKWVGGRASVASTGVRNNAGQPQPRGGSYGWDGGGEEVKPCSHKGLAKLMVIYGIVHT